MWKFSNLSLKSKLSVIVVGCSAIMLILTSLIYAINDYTVVRNSYLNDLHTIAKIIGINSTASLSFGDVDSATEILQALKVKSSVENAYLYNAEGLILAHYDADQPYTPPAVMSPLSQPSHTFSGKVLEIFSPIFLENQFIGTIYLRTNVAVLAQRQRVYLTFGCIVLPLLFLASFFLAQRMQKVISEPILDLVSTTKNVALNQDYSLRVSQKSGDELGQLAASFNEMLRQIQHRDTRLRNEIRERELAQTQLRQSHDELEMRVQTRTAELKNANEELEAFSYSVSHDLRAPLRGIAGFAKVLSEDSKFEINVDSQHALQMIHDGAKKMGVLINDLLSFAHLSRQSIHKKNISMTKIAHQCLAELIADDTGRDLEIKIQELPESFADATFIKQVYMNLLSNALKYTRLQPKTIIEVGATHNASSQMPDQIVYFVRDNGVGFDMQYAQKLFGVFQRLHLAEDYEGTGVGLAIVQRIILRHGGQIWAEATPNKGATFYFTLS